MKIIKSFKYFEAFDSKTLSGVYAYIKDKSKFKEILKKLCDGLDFPLSSLSEDLFKYLPYSKAKNLTREIIPKECEYEWDGKKCTGETGDELQGTILRPWGSGRRRVKCPVCKGEGKITPDVSKMGIKYLKFWFDSEGKFIKLTATNGKKIILNTDLNNLSSYSVVKSLTHSQLRDYENGTPVFLNARLGGTSTSRGSGLGFIFNKGESSYIIQNFAGGTKPTGYGWKVYGDKSWCIQGVGDYYQLDLLELKEPLTSEYSVNFDFDFNRLASSLYQIGNKPSDIKSADFALVLDYEKFVENAEKNKNKPSVLSKTRVESREGSLALKLPEEIKKENYKRYMEKLTDIDPDFFNDYKNIKNIILRLYSFSYIGYYIIGGHNYNKIRNILDYLLEIIDDPENVENVKKNINIIKSISKDVIEINQVFTKNINNNMKRILDNCKGTQREKIYDIMVDLNRIIVERVRKFEFETIEDILYFRNNIIDIGSILEHNKFSFLRNIKSIFSYLEEDSSYGSESRFVRILYDDSIINQYKLFVKYINRI